MKVVIDGAFVAGHRWGVYRAVSGLLRGLSQLHQPAQYTAVVADPGDFELPSGPIEVLVQPQARHSSWRRLIWQHRRLPRLLAELPADVFHAARYVGPWRCPVPMVATVYDVLALTRPELVRRGNRWHFYWALPRTVRSAQKVIVPSEWTGRQIHERLRVPRDKIVLAPLGVDDWELPADRAAEAERVRRKHNLPDRFVLFVGHVEPKKNLPATVRAFARARRRAGFRHHLVLAGTRGWGWPAVARALTEAEASDFVHSMGPVAQPDLPGLYAAADLLIHWSLAEGFGLTPLEAMRVGTPVLCSDEGALPEVIGDAGVMVPVTDADLLEAELGRLLGDESARAGLTARGRAQAARYTWQAHAEQVFRVYQEVHARVH